jgi:hypothetical protein
MSTPTDPPPPGPEGPPPAPLPTIRGAWFLGILFAVIAITAGFAIYFSQFKGKIAVPTSSESERPK